LNFVFSKKNLTKIIGEAKI